MRKISPSEIGKKVNCACGCGKIIDKYDKDNRERKYSKGHKGKMQLIKDKIVDLYINQGKNSYEVAKIYNCSDVTILNVLRRNGIKIRTSGESLKGVRKGIKQTKKHIENRTKAVIESYNKYPELRKLRGEAIKLNIWDNPEKKEKAIKKTIETKKRLFKEGKIKVWNKDKTHLDDSRIAFGERVHTFNKPRPIEVIEKISKTKKMKYAMGLTKSWNKGLTKERIKKKCKNKNCDKFFEVLHSRSKQQFCSLSCANSGGYNPRYRKEYSGTYLINDENDVNKVKDLYLNQKKSSGDIAKIFNCSHTTILNVLKKNRVPINNHGYLNIGKKRKPFSDITRKKMSEKMKEQFKTGERKISGCAKLSMEGQLKAWNKDLTKETDERVKRNAEATSKTRKRKFESGELKITEETRKIWSKNRSGEGNHQWLGGLSFKPYDSNFNSEFKEQIRKRDNHVCLKCGKSEYQELQDNKRKLTVHHIDYNKEFTCKENCCALCLNCNIEVNYKRNQWKKFFQSLLSEKYGYNYSGLGDIILNIKDKIQEVKNEEIKI